MNLIDFVESTVSGLISGAIVVFIGVKSVKDYVESRERKHSIATLGRFWQSSGRFSIVFGVQDRGTERVSFSPRVGYAQAFGVSEITRAIEQVNPKADIRLVPVKTGAPVPRQAFEDNIVLIGGELVLPAIRCISLEINAPFYQHDMSETPRCISRQDIHGNFTDKLYSSQGREPGVLLSDIGTICRIVNPLNNRLIIVFNANHSAGLLGAMLFASRPEEIARLTLPATNGAQVVVQVENLEDNLIGRDHPVNRVRLVDFQVDPANLVSAITKIANG